MTADGPTILATSGGLRRGTRTTYVLAPLVHFAVELAGVTGRAPRICYVGTAGGDQRYMDAFFREACDEARYVTNFAHVYPMPNAENMAEHILNQDVIWVGGGSVANLVALWRLHGLDKAFFHAWQSGVVLAGVSAGSICWHVGGTTDSFGETLQPVEGLGFLPFANGVHHDSEQQRRPLITRLVAEGALPDAYATDDGVGLLYRDAELVEAVTEVNGKGAYHIRRDGEGAVEERIEPRALPGAL